MVDVFKSRIKGKVFIDKDQTIIHLNVYLSWLLILFNTICLVLNSIFLVDFVNGTNAISFKYVTLLLIAVILPMIISVLKLQWDKRRLKKWLSKNL